MKQFYSSTLKYLKRIRGSRQLKLTNAARMLSVLAILLCFSNLVGFSQTSTCEYPAANEKTDPWSPECYFTDNCVPQGTICAANDVIITRIYIGDINGDPISPFCPFPGHTDLYLWGEFNANAVRYAVRTYFEIWDETGLINDYNIATSDVVPVGINQLKLTPLPVEIICGHEYEIRNSFVAWETVSTATLANTTNCDQYQSSKCSKNTGTNKFYIIVPSISYGCTVDYAENGVTVSFTGSASGGVQPYTFEWDFGDGTPKVTTANTTVSHTFNTSSSGTFTVKLKVSDTPNPADDPPYPGTYGTVEQDITLPRITDCPGPVSTMCPDGPQLTLATLTSSAEPSGGTGVYHYDSGGSLNYTHNQEITIFDPSLAGQGTHTLYYLYTKDGCSAICYFNIVVAGPTATITAQTNVACFGGSTGSVTVGGSGGTTPYEYSLDGGAYQSSGTFNNLATDTYTVTVKDANGCTFDVPVTITQPEAALTATASADNLICNEGTTTLIVNAIGGTSPYQYSLDNIVFQSSNEFTVTSGTYTIYVKDENGCTYIIPSYNIQNACMTIVKTGTLDMTVVAPSDRADAGDKINYAFTVTNTGNVTLTGITVTDPKLVAPNGSISGGPITLAPGASDATTFTGSYTLTLTDINAGTFTNTATATGNPADRFSGH